jgi:hypothetical protein
MLGFGGLSRDEFHKVVDHVGRKHPEMLSLVGFTKEQLISSIVKALESPNGVYADDLYLNVIAVGNRVRTTYLMGGGTFTRMGKAGWLHRLY